MWAMSLTGWTSLSSKVDLVLHVSQLKLVAGFKGPVTEAQPPSVPKFSVPLQILRTRGVTKGSRLAQQVLVEWFGSPRDLAT